MAETQREERQRERDAVTREMRRLRSTDVPDAPDDDEGPDLVDTVTEEQQRARDAQDEDPPY
jgi:hypothetical protein